jgi:hypothetical protein
VDAWFFACKIFQITDSGEKNQENNQQATAPTKSISSKQQLLELGAPQVAAQTQLYKGVG